MHTLSYTGMSKQTSYSKIYRPDIQFVQTSADVQARPQLPCRRIFTRGWVFTARSDSKKCIRADAPLRPRGCTHVRMGTSASTWTQP
jgi:hypothetical protein